MLLDIQERTYEFLGCSHRKRHLLVRKKNRVGGAIELCTLRYRKAGQWSAQFQNTDVFVIGGGPAGLAVAIAARQKGLQAIVADGAAPPIEKPCGEGMMPETLAALRDLGVEIPAGQDRNSAEYVLRSRARESPPIFRKGRELVCGGRCFMNG
jgi:NADPH-dependent 2,4-dienoyl-CoA reductase/sulfur reductase-like enzyme